MNQPQKKRPQKTLVRSLHYCRKVSIAYYLTHRQEIEEYLQQQETAANALQEQLESNPDYQAEIAELRYTVTVEADQGFLLLLLEFPYLEF